MARRQKNRSAWQLVVALTAVLLGALVVLGVTYGNRLLQGEEIGRISLAPRDCWGFGWSTLYMSFGPGGLNREWFVVGCLAWRVEYDPPLTSANSSTHRSWW
jgi:hypothetical protein